MGLGQDKDKLKEKGEGKDHLICLFLVWTSALTIGT